MIMDKMCETKRTKIIETTYTSWQGVINHTYNELKNTLNNAYWFLEGTDSNLMTFQLFSNPDKKEVEFVACNLGSDIFDCLKLNNENLISTGGYVIKDNGGKEIINPALDIFKQDLANSISDMYLNKGTFNRYALSKTKIINAIDREIFAEYNYQKVIGFIFDGMGTALKFFIDQFRGVGKKIEEYRLSEKSYLPDANGFDPILNGALLKAIGVNTTIPIEKYTYSKEDLEYYQIKEKQVDWTLAINAEFCGFWNALIDTADGFAMLLPSLYQILSDRATFKQFFRVIVDFLMMTPQELGDILTAYDFENSKGSIYRLSYQQCYEISMILSLFLPIPKIGKAGRATEALGEISAWLANFSTKNELILLAYKMGLRVERTTGEWQLVFGKYTLLKGSREKVLKMIEDIGEMSKFEGNQNLSSLEKQLNEAVIEENGITRKLTKAEKEEILEKFRHEGGNSNQKSIVATTIDEEVKAFEVLEKKYLDKIIENPFENLKEVLPLFNHTSLEKVVIQIGDENCGDVVDAIINFLKNKKIRRARDSGYETFEKVAAKYGGGYFQQLHPATLKGVFYTALERLQVLMKNDEIVVIYGVNDVNSITKSTSGHYFVGVKKDGILHLFDGQTGQYMELSRKPEFQAFLRSKYNKDLKSEQGGGFRFLKVR
ncbi:hypothetical protein VUJ46_16345 [Chryseobacterium sp. MYb264]|uniref:hypothetical protein n=1 Tax=Chryseobacterium sp. MYb264 TaxID=2745153 RepID=UPI002E109E14|nr:hypothetical protein VUJ46_16345 [Chryseobacterium sp. MYb264]